MPPLGRFSPRASLSAYSNLVLQLDSPLGRYEPLIVPLQRSSDSHSTVNYVVEATEELEQHLEGVIRELNRSGSYRRLASVLFSQSVDVTIEPHTSEAIVMRVQGGMKLVNGTNIPLFIRCWLGHVLVFAQIMTGHSEIVSPPYASHLPYLHFQIQPLVCNAEELEAKRLQSLNERQLNGFVFSSIEIQGSQLTSSLQCKCYRSDVRECDEKELCQDISELGLVISSFKQSHSRYQVSFLPLITIRNCLPIHLAVNCSVSSISLPLFADTHSILLSSLQEYPVYDHWSDRVLAMTPLHMRCDTSVSLLNLLGIWSSWLDSNQTVNEDECFECTMECSDYDSNPLSLTCRCEWFRGGITIQVFVPFWLQIESTLPLLFHCFTSKEKETEVCNQHFEQESNRLLLLDSVHRFLTISTPTTNVSPPIQLRSLIQTYQNRVVTLTDRWRLGLSVRYTHSLLLTSLPAPDSIPMTHVLLLTPRIQILNNTSLHLELHQEGAPDSESFILPVNQLLPLSLIHGCKQAFRVRLLNGPGVWSSSLIHLDEIRRGSNHDKTLYLRTLSDSMEFLLVHVNSRDNGSLDVVIDHSRYGGTDLPVIFSNQTLYPLQIRQYAVPQAAVWFIAPYSSSSFFWADEDWSHVLDVDVLPIYSRGTSTLQGHLKLDCSTSRTRIHLRVPNSDHDQRLAASVEVLRSVVFVHLKYLPVDESRYPQIPLSNETLISRPLRLEVKIPAIHLTLLTARGYDLMCLSGTQLCLRVCRNALTDVQVSLHRLEVSNQLMEAKYPVMLVMKPTFPTQQQSTQYCLNIRCSMCEGNSADFGHCLFITNIECDVAPITLVLEHCLIKHITMFQSIHPSTIDRDLIRPNNFASIFDYLISLHDYSNKRFHYHYPRQPRASALNVMKSRSQLYEESRHIRVQRLHISSLSLTLSLSLTPPHISTCPLFFLDSLCVSLHPITIAETYPRRMSYMRNLLFHSYKRALLLQIPVLLLSLRCIGAPAVFLQNLLENLERLAVDLIHGSHQSNLLTQLQHTGRAITRYIDQNLTNVSLVALNVITTWLGALTMILSLAHVSVQSHLLHGSLSSFSPFLASSRSSYGFRPLVQQIKHSLFYLMYSLTRVTRPLQHLLTNLQFFRSSLEGSSYSPLRLRAPNLTINGVLLPYDPVYCRGRGWMMCVNDGKYANEDCLAVYSISQACLVITRTYLVMLRTRQNRIEVMCEVVFDDCVSLKSVCFGENRYALEFICFPPVDLFDHASTSMGVVFGCRLEKRSMYIGKGNAAKQVCDKVEQIIRNEVMNHNYGKY